MGYSAKAIANFFIGEYRLHGITPLKLQKLVYLSHGWHLALYDDDLVDDEYAEAWQYGPVFPSLYHELKHLRSAPVFTLTQDFDDDLDIRPPKVDPDDDRTRALLNRIWDVYGKHSAMQLSALTHAPGSPWDKAYKRDGSRRNPHIDDEEIKQHYRDLMKDNERTRQTFGKTA